MAALALAAALLLFAAGPQLEARVARLLAERGLGETLAVIDNTLRHEGPTPREAPPLARELLARPLDALDAKAIFERSVPEALRNLAAEPAPGAAQPFERLLDAYLEELAVLQADLLAATAPFDEAKVLQQLGEGVLSADTQLEIGAAVDREALARVSERFIAVTARFAREVSVARDWPAPSRFQSAIGLVVIGSRGSDQHGPAALIIDPGGDDVYERTPAAGGAIAVVIDLAGNDSYRGSDFAMRGLSALFDLAGDDRYELQGPGLGMALAGASLLFDQSGNDRYRVPYFGQGFALFGLGALIDRGGSDSYEIDAWGQGSAFTGGLALLWDADGNDSYVAHGLPDAYDRGGGLSGAQGVAMGIRNMLPGGIGILRDDGGNDVYSAEMFAQGTGYFYGLGLLWDRGGDDRYQALRYAQGAGVHEAVGVLRDEDGNDDYALKVGVGQGMGLDLALGVLVDTAGDDHYAAGLLAQAAATANGIGILADGGGADRFQVDAGDRQWGHAQWSRGMPSLGVFLYDPARASFQSDGKPLAAPPPARKVAEPEPDAKCPPGVTVAIAEIEKLRREHFDSVYELGGRLRCAVGDPQQAALLWPALDAELARDPASALAGWIALAFAARPPSPPLYQSLLDRLDAHPYCSVRALALAAVPRAEVARRALGSSCWRLQAAGARALEKLGAR
jgi:hypothetical protein